MAEIDMQSSNNWHQLLNFNRKQARGTRWIRFTRLISAGRIVWRAVGAVALSDVAVRRTAAFLAGLPVTRLQAHNLELGK